MAYVYVTVIVLSFFTSTELHFRRKYFLKLSEKKNIDYIVTSTSEDRWAAVLLSMVGNRDRRISCALL